MTPPAGPIAWGPSDAVLEPPAPDTLRAGALESPHASVGEGARYALLGATALWVAAVMAWRWPVVGRPAFRGDSPIDAAFYTYAGQLLRSGGTPYLTFWDHKPPLIFALHAAGLAVSRGRLWGVWLVSVVAVLVALWCAERALRYAFGAAGASLGLVYFAFSVPAILSVGLTEWYALPIAWASALVVVRRDPLEQDPRVTGALLGALGAAAMLLKPNMIGAPLSAGLVVLLALLTARRYAAVLPLAVGALVGAVAVLGPTLGALAAVGALGAFRDQVITYNGVYVGTGPGWRLRLRAVDGGVTAATALTSAVLPIAGWLVAATAAVRTGVRGRRGVALALTVVWLPVEIALAATSGRAYGHYFTTLFPPLAFAVGCLAAALEERQPWRADGRRASLRVATALAIAVAGIASWRVVWRMRDEGIDRRRADQVDATVAYVRTHVAANAPLFIWGHAADVYLFSGRRPATPYVYVQPLLTPGYATDARVTAFVRALREARPPIIVDAGGRDAATRSIDGADLTPSLGVFDATWSYPRIKDPLWNGPSWWSMPLAMKQFYDFVAADYVPVDSVGAARWVIYRRRDIADVTSHPAAAR